MGKNKNRNRRNKKKNASPVETKKALDEQVNVSTTVADCNPSPAVKEGVSVRIKYTVEDKKICKTQSASNINQKSLSSSTYISTNCKGTSSETITHKDGVYKAVRACKIVPGCSYLTKSTSRVQTSIDNYAKNTQLSIQSNYATIAQPAIQNHARKAPLLIDSNYSGEVQPLVDGNYAKDFPCIKNNNAKITQNVIQNNKFPTINKDEAFDKNASTSENKSSLGSTTSMKGARPKNNTRQLKISPLSNVLQSTKDKQNFKQHIQGSVRQNKNHWDHFERLYRTWKIERQNTIQKLNKLVEEVHKDQMMFNQGHVTLKEWNVGSREVKNRTVSPAVDFLASLAAFVTDAASSVTSVVQACNVDNYATTFKEIMENDAEVTRPLYAARSQSLVEYRNIEEIIRRCHQDTFGSTIGNISSTLKVEDLWLDIKNAKGENSLGQIIDGVDLFLRRNANAKKMGEIYDSIQGYLNSNHAALEACKYAGRAMYDVYDTWGRDPKQRASIANNMSLVSNSYFLLEEKEELDNLRSKANNDEEIQAKLESDIHIAIRSLKYEMEEISNIFEEKSQVYNQSLVF